MKKVATAIAFAAGAIGFAWAAQESVAFRYCSATAIVILVLYVLFRTPERSKHQIVAEFECLKREQAELTARAEQAYRERWPADAQASVARCLAEVEQKLATFR